MNLDELGGLTRLKDWLRRREQCAGDDAAAFGISSPRGILLLGVQGAGKSLAAKAVATAWRQPLLRMDAGALYDRYIGESDRRLRDALQQAERMAPVVLWIDEIEKGFASAASQSSDGGLSSACSAHCSRGCRTEQRRSFLSRPPTISKRCRLNCCARVGLTKSSSWICPISKARAAIFAIHLAKRKRDPKTFDLGRIAEASDGRSGAEIEAAVVSALHDAFAAGTELKTEHILAALAGSPPLSVTMAEKMSALREWSVGRCVPAD